MSYSNGRGSVMRFNDQQLAPTCYIQTLITGECASRPTAFEPSLRGVAPSANNAYIVRFRSISFFFKLHKKLNFFFSKGSWWHLWTQHKQCPYSMWRWNLLLRRLLWCLHI